MSSDDEFNDNQEEFLDENADQAQEEQEYYDEDEYDEEEEDDDPRKAKKRKKKSLLQQFIDEEAEDDEEEEEEEEEDEPEEGLDDFRDEVERADRDSAREMHNHRKLLNRMEKEEDIRQMADYLKKKYSKNYEASHFGSSDQLSDTIIQQNSYPVLKIRICGL